jgi:hypothetical protein
MSKVNSAEQVSITNCARLIALTGRYNTIIVEGEPGTGKTSIQTMLKDILGTKKYEYIYCDCPLKDMGDVSMNIPVHDTKELEQYVAHLFNLNSDIPKVIMLDEIWKSDKMMKKIWTRLVQERYVGDRALPEGSIVWGTSNNSSDGVGDMLEGHVGNRVTRIRMRKPDHKEWPIWAGDHGISALTRAWVTLNPSSMHSYTELSVEELNNNPFIFNPKKNMSTFVSPRSLEKNDLYVKIKDQLGDKLTMSAMAGTIGLAGAESMNAFFLIEKDLVPVREIINNPEKARLNEMNAGVLLMTIFNSVDEILTQDDLSAFMRYMKRVKSVEMQSIAYVSYCQSKKTLHLAKSNKELSEFMIENFYLFT